MKTYLNSFGAGMVAAITTADPLHPAMSLVYSTAVVILSVLFTGLVSNWLNRRSLMRNSIKTDAEISSINIDNSARLLNLKQQETADLLNTVDHLLVEVKMLTKQVEQLRIENARLTVLLGSSLKEILLREDQDHGQN
jgi:hypothetical protein